MSAETVSNDFQPIKPSDLIVYIEPLQEVAEAYAPVEESKYRRRWNAADRLDGAFGDLGIAALNDLRQRSMYPLEGSLLPLGPDTDPKEVENLNDKTEHEIVDLLFSNVSASDKLGLNTKKICKDQDQKPPLQDTPAQALSRIAIVFAGLRQLVDPPKEPLPMQIIVPKGQELAPFLAGEGFRSIVCLANGYELDLGRAVTATVDGLMERIPGEHRDRIAPS